ncbi:MAG: hypothetical protein IID44_00290 [Planctomycetes bacterium]|nr:hypothetical protein [Planctomycetota bacterium]
MADEQQRLPSDPQGSIILTEKEIRRFVKNGQLISEETFDGACLQSTSYDVRIGKKAISGGHGNDIDMTKDRLTIGPGSYAGVISLERLKLPNNVLARIGSKRKFSYEGLILLTGSVVDPGYEGHLLFGLYNASSAKRVLRMSGKICTLIFEKLDSDQKPVGSDPDLLVGEFPGDFLTSMANMDVMPWAEISDEVKRIQQLAKDVLDLKQQYGDVIEPIQRLTSNVDNVTNDVRQLTQELRRTAKDVDAVRALADDNTRSASQVLASVNMLVAKTTEQDAKLTSLGIRFGTGSMLANIILAIVMLVLGSAIALGLTSLLSGK